MFKHVDPLLLPTAFLAGGILYCIFSNRNVTAKASFVSESGTASEPHESGRDGPQPDTSSTNPLDSDQRPLPHSLPSAPHPISTSDSSSLSIQVDDDVNIISNSCGPGDERFTSSFDIELRSEPPAAPPAAPPSLTSTPLDVDADDEADTDSNPQRHGEEYSTQSATIRLGSEPHSFLLPSPSYILSNGTATHASEARVHINAHTAASHPNEISAVTSEPNATVGLTRTTLRAGGDINIITTAASATAEWQTKLRKFLSPLTPEVRHRDVSDDLSPGTGKWFLEDEMFQKWLTSDETINRVLCYVGDPGVGKTGLACRAFEMLYTYLAEDNSALGFVYCDHVSREKQTATHLLGALLGQLINRLSADNAIVKELTSRRREGKLLDQSACIDYIRRISTSGEFEVVRLGVDGLDELLPKHRADFLKSLGALSTSLNIRFLLFGRDNSGIQREVDSFFCDPGLFTCNKITGERTADDRRLFLQQCLDRSDWSNLDADLKNDIFKKLAGPNSTFLLANLQITHILSQPTKRQVINAIKSIKFDLSLMYQHMLARITERGLKLLHWVLHAVRELTIEELRFAAGIQDGMTDLDCDLDLPPSQSFLDSALGLLTLERRYVGDQIVRFSHSTIKDYLSDHTSKYFPGGHLTLAQTTLTYLSFNALSSAQGRARFLKDGDLKPFFRYAALYWGVHVREADDITIYDIAMKCILTNQYSYVHDLRRHSSTGDGWLSSYQSLLHEACYFGLQSVATKLMKLGHDVNSLNCYQMTPLHFAALHGHSSVVQALLQCEDISINAQDKSGNTPLHIALREQRRPVERGHSTIVDLLLQHSDIQVDVVNKKGQLPLHLSTEYGNPGTVSALLSRSNAVNYCALNGRTPLMNAMFRVDPEIVEMLLMHEHIDIEASKISGPEFMEAMLALHDRRKSLMLPHDLLLCLGLTAEILYVAASEGATDVVLGLIHLPNLQLNSCQDSRKRTALHQAALKGHSFVVEVLLQHPDIELNYRDLYGHTPLMDAVYMGHIEIVEMFLKHENIDIEASQIAGPEFLRTMLSSGDAQKYLALPLVLPSDLLLRLGLASEILYVAAKEGVTDIVLELIHLPNLRLNSCQDSRQRTALHQAVLNGHANVVAALLQHPDIEVTYRDLHGHTPLIDAVWTGNSEIAVMLLTYEHIDKESSRIAGPEFLEAMLASHDKQKYLLLPHDLLHWLGLTSQMLYVAASEGATDVVLELLQLPNLQLNLRHDQGKRTALHQAVLNGHADAVEALLQHPDIELNYHDLHNHTPLMDAVSMCNTGIVLMLLTNEHINIEASQIAGPEFLEAMLSSCDKQKYLMLPRDLLLHLGLTSEILYVAASEGATDIVLELLQLPNLQLNSCHRRSQRTALHEAALNGHTDVIEALLQHSDIEPDLSDCHIRTALIVAANAGQDKSVKVLLQHPEVKVNAMDVNGWTALTCAVDEGHGDVVRALLACRDIDIGVSRVAEAGFWDIKLGGCLIPALKHMTLPVDLLFQLRMWSPYDLTAFEIELYLSSAF